MARNKMLSTEDESLLNLIPTLCCRDIYVVAPNQRRGKTRYLGLFFRVAKLPPALINPIDIESVCVSIIR